MANLTVARELHSTRRERGHCPLPGGLHASPDRRHFSLTGAALCHADKKSLIDLGVLPNAAGDWPLRTILDHTHSKAAHHALLALLSSPLNSVNDIVARQELLRALPLVVQQLNWLEVGERLQNLEKYLDSNFVVFPLSTLEATLFALRHKDITAFVERNVKSFAAFIELCSMLRGAIASFAGDTMFRRMLDRFDDVLDTSIREELSFAQAAGHKQRSALCHLDKRIRVELRDRLLQLISAFHMFDAFCSLADAAQMPGLSFPEMVERQSESPMERQAGSLAITGLHHPLLKHPKPNDIVLKKERVMFLTGPNMAGKSTLLRALGIAVLFAHVGLPVPAACAAIPLTDRLIASLGNEDNQLRGESLYLAEVRRVKSVAAAVANGECVVALLDEVFRGTNVKDAADATSLLVSGLARARCGVFAISSHLVEVAQASQGTPAVGFWCMQVGHANGQHTFTYILERGVSDVRLGMTLLRSEGVVDLLTRIGRIDTGPQPM